ncbi:MAG: hypothetical protein M3280_13835 [Actinomycetota bacterium]|nr:hypothetical protein [Actinomycetota bacterium]
MRTDHRFARTMPSEDRFSIRTVAAGTLTALIMLFFFASSASACPITDPRCALDDAKKTVKDITEDPVGRVKDTVKTVEDKVTKVVDDANKTVDDTVGDVEDKIRTKPTVPGKPKEPKTPRPPRVKSDDLSRRDDRRPGSETGNKRTGRTGDTRVRPGDGTRVEEPVTLKSDRLPVAPIAPAASASQSTERQDFAEAAIEAARKFAFPLLLTIIVGLFLAAQNRLDRKDPKLALAPLDQDLLSFR